MPASRSPDPTGESSMPFPAIAHFSGTIDGQPQSRAYVSVQAGRLIAYLHGSSGFVYVGPDESGLHYVVRSSDSPLNDAASAQPWTCGEEQLPAALTASAEPTYPAVTAPLAGLKQAAVRIETDNQLYVHFGSDPAQVASYAATLFGAIIRFTRASSRCTWRSPKSTCGPPQTPTPVGTR